MALKHIITWNNLQAIKGSVLMRGLALRLVAMQHAQLAKYDGPAAEPVAWWIVPVWSPKKLVMGFGQTAWQAWLSSSAHNLEFSAVRCFRAE